jgi:zinc-binding alcohol dehydrogenase family protein
VKAVGYTRALPIDDATALQDLTLGEPTTGPHDLLVRVSAVSVNPVDTKVRKNRAPKDGVPEVLGWDAVGTVQAVGDQVGKHATGFAVGDRVYYAGAINRPGSNSELHVVDARIAAHAPNTLDDAQAAALPLTSITAWELLFDRLQIAQGGGTGQSLLVIGGAGGVGSILIQLARQLTGLRIIATASRPETQAWCKTLGAHEVIDHSKPLRPQLDALGIAHVQYAASLTQSAQHWDALIDALAPQGKLGLIDDIPGVDAGKLKTKSLSLHWELMFTRSMFTTPDIAQQGALLAEVAKLVDAGKIKTTLAEHFGVINAANLKRAHALVESGTARGKVVLQDW